MKFLLPLLLLLPAVSSRAAPATPDYIALPAPLINEILTTMNRPMDNRQLVELWTRVVQCVQEQTPGQDGAIRMQGACPAAVWINNLQEVAAASGKAAGDKPAPPLSVSHPMTAPAEAKRP
jgi:hypothetical protein